MQNRGKVQYLAFTNILLVLTKFTYCEDNWALSYNSEKFDLLLIFTFFDKLDVNLYITFSIVIITFFITC